MATLIQILKSHAQRTNLPIPSAAIGVPNAAVRQMIALLEEVGQDLTSRFRWQFLTKKASWTSVATESQGNIYTLASDASLERIIPNSFYNEAQNVYFIGPVSTEQWQAYTGGLVSAAESVYIIYENELRVYPTMTAGETCSFMYQSRSWIKNGATYKSAFTSDDDEILLDEDLVKLGLRHLWKMEKGLPYAEDMRKFEAMALDKAARGMTQPIVSMAGGNNAVRPSVLVPLWSTIPDA